MGWNVLEWVAARYKTIQTSWNRSEQVGICWNRLKQVGWAGLDWNGLEWTGMGWNGLEWMKLGKMEWVGCVGIGSCRSKPKVGIGWHRLEWATVIGKSVLWCFVVDFGSLWYSFLF
jgi:hypothetical protein